MKKLLFSALACVVFAFSGFASNEVVEEVDFQIEGTHSCEFNITITSQDGQHFELFMFFSNLTGRKCHDSIPAEVSNIKKLYPDYAITVGIATVK